MSATEAQTLPRPLPILIVPDPMLRKVARPVTPDDAGTLQTLIVVDVAPDQTPAPIALVNPEVIARSEEKATREEGCLSLPDQYAEVTRPAWVKVRYQDEHGAKREVESDGLLAACLQHEIDHLNGVLFVDYLSPLKRNILLRKLAKEQKERRGR